jgi:hypothetical protein
MLSTKKKHLVPEISGFCGCVAEVFAVVEWYAAFVGS